MGIHVLTAVSFFCDRAKKKRKGKSARTLLLKKKKQTEKHGSIWHFDFFYFQGLLLDLTKASMAR